MERNWVDRSGRSACITDIQRFSVHDGPGIRTIVFFKGCPLRCKWCQNPETQLAEPEIMFAPDNCVGCGQCIAVCPQRAITVIETGVRYDRERCTRCGACINLCGPEARKMVGRIRTFDEILKTVLADRVFYKNTNGGLTVSGGEPTVHAEFVARLLHAVKREQINTAMETCGMCEEGRFLAAIEDCDLLLFDVKHTDTEVHKLYTGFGNEVILKNLRQAASLGKEIIVRIPLIPSVNDGEENLRETGWLAREVHAKEVHLLPFHQMGQEKWHSLDKEYECEQMPLPSEQLIARSAAILKESGVTVNVGGYGEYKWLLE